MKAKYEISGIEKAIDEVSGEVCGGDRTTLYELNSKSKAFVLAKKESRKNKWHETTVYKFDDKYEILGHWYFKNGKLLIDMSV